VQGLNLGFLVATEHQGAFGWIQVQPKDVPEFGFKVRIARKLKDFRSVRLKVIFYPEPMDGGFRDALVLGHGPHAPARQAGRRLGYLADDPASDLRGDGGFAPAARPVLQRAESLLDKARPSPADRVVVQAHFPADLAIGHPVRGQKDHPRSPRLVPPAPTGVGHGLQPPAFLVVQIDYRCFSHPAEQVNTSRENVTII
jgi:hypothetical protein